MPVYEYKCLTCGYQFEKLVKVDAPNPPCPAVTDKNGTAPKTCGQVTEKLISKTSFVLKGGGWASDGY